MNLSLFKIFCKSRILRARSVGAAILWFVLITAIILCWPMDVGFYTDVVSSVEMVDREGRLLYAFLNETDDWCFACDLGRISPHLIRATIAAEDQRFGTHPGVDPVAVVRAALQNLSEGRIVSGASTLAMQVIKLAHRRRGSSCGKILQAVQAVRLQARVGSEGILLAYLNNAPYGGNLIGCEASARRYFGKSAKELTLCEAAFLAGLPKAPSLYSPYRHPKKALARRNYILKRMREEGFITDAELKEAEKQPLGVGRYSFTNSAPHLALRLRAERNRSHRIETTLDARIQSLAQDCVKRAVEKTGGEVENGAAIVVDTENAEVLAWVGSADFLRVPGGQVDVCRAARSPGSALKPFVYGLAMERNRLYACETLLDDNWDRGLYNPENFDLEYCGLVSASEALRQSLNIPAIIALQRVGTEQFYSFLKRIGLSTLVYPAERYGLGLVLGGCEATLEELTAAYCALANLGTYRPLSLLISDRGKYPGKRILSRGICFALYEMLEQPLPSDLEGGTVPRVSIASRVCWKTGTSQGYRDAWAFVWNRHYVVGVWMGNNDGRPSRRLVGAQVALPLAAEIFRSLPQKNTPAWPEPSGALREVSVCALSGLPATRWCEHRRDVFLPREQFLHRVCDVHYPAPGETTAVDTVIERWPGAADGWDLSKIQLPVIAFPEGCGARRYEDFRILQPPNSAEYILTGEPNGDRIRLETSVDATTRLHWYLDGRYLGDSLPGKPLLLRLEPGEHRLGCMTPEGKTDSVKYKVLLPEAAISLETAYAGI